MLIKDIVWDKVVIKHPDPARPDKVLEHVTLHIQNGIITLMVRRRGGGFFDNAGTYVFNQLTELTPWSFRIAAQGVEDTPRDKTPVAFTAFIEGTF